MIGTSQPFTPRKAILALLGAALFAAGAVGGWILWPRSVDEAPTKGPARPQPASSAIAKAAPIAVMAIDAGTPQAMIDKAEPAKPEEARQKQPTQGKNHDREEALLASLAQLLQSESAAGVDAGNPQAALQEEPTQGKNHEPQAELLANMARLMHAEAHRRFVNQPGMGMTRMVPTLSLMPREWKMPQWTSEELAKEQPPLNGAKDLGLIHRLSLKNFGDSSTKSTAERWTDLAKEARTQEMKKELTWEIKSLDLVGLVVHETPVVYVSDKIPDMKDLKKKPTREPDVFESEGLEELSSGKALYIRAKDGTFRVLGPIHAAKACLKCHGDAKEGDLVGAFSYTLRQAQYAVNGGRPVGPNPAVWPAGPKK